MAQTIGQKIKALRKSRNVTQKILCGLLNMPLSTYSNKERNSTFSTDELMVICKALNYSYNDLIADKDINPYQFNNERTDYVVAKEPTVDIPLHDNSNAVYLTDEEKKLLKRIRNLTVDKKQKLLNCIDKIENGEQ